MNCKFLVKRIGYFYCKKQNINTTLSQCNKCLLVEQTTPNYGNYAAKNKSVLKRTKTPLKRVSKKQAKTEKNRFSIFTDDLEHCYLSKLYLNKEIPKDDLHEIFRGSKRQISKKWGLVIPISREFHENNKLLREWQIIGQKKAMEHYNWSIDEFREIFGRNYLK